MRDWGVGCTYGIFTSLYFFPGLWSRPCRAWVLTVAASAWSAESWWRGPSGRCCLLWKRTGTRWVSGYALLTQSHRRLVPVRAACNMKNCFGLSSQAHQDFFCPCIELIPAAKNSFFGHFVRYCDDFAHACAKGVAKGVTKTPQPALPQKCRKISRSVFFTARKGKKKQAKKISVVGLARRCNIVTLHCLFIWISYLEC